MKLRLSVLSAALLGAGIFNGALAQTTTDVGTVKISGSGDNLGNGLLIDEDGVKAKSTLTKSAIDKERATANPFQLLNLMPGVNASSYDATGLFGGNLRVRGFNSDEMGFTINGAPVNDSGNFAIYPQEYTDSENLCELFITQGSADTDAPHVGASGGNVGLVTCAPNDQAGGKLTESLGQLHFNKTFARLDTGLLGEDFPAKAFFSASHSTVDKFKGFGEAKRDHMDAGLDIKLSADTNFSSTILYNNAYNNNFLTLTKEEFSTNPSLDYSNVIPQHNVGPAKSESGVANFGYSSASSTTARTVLPYYAYSVNPFENMLITSRLQSRINSQLTLSAEPYFWYGYGTGGTEQNSLPTTSGNPSAFGNGIANFTTNTGSGTATTANGVYRGSVTETHRPGVTLKANYELEDQKILAGLWYEQANHRQTAPATTVSNSGAIGDAWLRTDLLTYNNGATYENRNWLTRNEAYSAFLQDTYKSGNLTLVGGLRYTSLTRRFNNYASGSGSGNASLTSGGGGADYALEATYAKALPSLGLTYKLSETTHAYANVTENMRAPSNSVLAYSVYGGSYVNGVLTGYTVKPNTDVTAETSTTYEGGVRYGDDFLKGSVAVFQVNFRNRLSQAYNPETNSYNDLNVGSSRMRGFELQAGTTPQHGWSAFGSATYTQSLILNNYQATATTTLPTAGSQFPDTPLWMYGASLQYSEGPFLAALNAKYTGKRYSTLVNDESIDGYTTVDFNAGYRFGNAGFLKNPTIRLNVSNLFNAKYLIENAGSGSNIYTTINTSTAGGGVPTYYVGAPRFTSMSLSADF